MASGTSTSATIASRRHSSRSIKRKKFDDELVESSIQLKSSRKSSEGCIAEGSIVSTTGKANELLSTSENVPTTSKVDVIEKKMTTELSRKSTAPPEKKIICKKKKIKRSRQAFAAVKDMGRWKPTDDILLIDAVEQLLDISLVKQCVKFSCYFTLEEIQERWYALLYDPVISSLAKQAMKNLPVEISAVTHAKAPYSDAEERVLEMIPSRLNPDKKYFQSVLEKNASIFHSFRSETSLQKHWELMKFYHMLCDQQIKTEPLINFSEAEDLLDSNDSSYTAAKDESLEQEMRIADRKNKLQVKQLEEEIPCWELLVSNLTKTPLPELDQHTVAVLRGQLVRYLMRSREITIGRCTDNCYVDIDLSLEGPAQKVSRRQGIIKLKNNGDFFLVNEGKQPFYVDGKAVVKGNKSKLGHDSVIEIALLRFVFQINQQIVSTGPKF